MKALEGVPRGAYYLATKIGRYDVDKFDFTAERTVKSVHESLSKLKCGHIDLIQVRERNPRALNCSKQCGHELVKANR